MAVDHVWTGVRIQFGVVATDRDAFVAYFDPERQLTVARINLKTCVVERKKLPSRFEGWDSHNDTVIALDNAGLLHVAGNMHANPLVYFRGSKSLDIQSLSAAGMVGSDENRVTYPRFIHADNRLLFMYRDGRAGDGQWFMNEWAGSGWRRVSAQALFDADRAGQVSSAYPSEFALGPDGFYHVSVVWMGDPNARRGQADADPFDGFYRLSYAKTRDFKQWLSHDGKPLAAPLSPDTMQVVDDVGYKRGLMNNAKVAVDDAGIPHITYTKYTPNSRNGAFVAIPEGASWRSELLAESEELTPIEKKRTVLPTVSQVIFEEGGAGFVARFPGEKLRQVKLRGQGAALGGRSARNARSSSDPRLTAVARNLQAPDVVTAISFDQKGKPSPKLRFVSMAQAPNRNKPRECTPRAPLACKPPPSPLLLEIE